jgi:arginine exporter protein ArgO
VGVRHKKCTSQSLSWFNCSAAMMEFCLAGDDCAVAERGLEREDAYGVIKASASWFERLSMRMGRLEQIIRTIPYDLGTNHIRHVSERSGPAL